MAAWNGFATSVTCPNTATIFPQKNQSDAARIHLVIHGTGFVTRKLWNGEK